MYNGSSEHQEYNYERYYSRKRKRRQRRNKLIFYLVVFFWIIISIMAGIIIALCNERKQEEKVKQNRIDTQTETERSETEEIRYTILKPEWDIQFLTPNEYSRPQTPLEEVTGVVIHYTGNPGTTAKQNRSFFESLAQTGATSASSHFVVGMEGEIIQCIPLDEIAYASRDRNKDTISIEVCHPTTDGKFTDETYDSLIKLVAWLVVEYDLEIDDVIRHYDVTGKICPKYYVEHEDAWEEMKKDIEDYIEENIEETTEEDTEIG